MKRMILISALLVATAAFAQHPRKAGRILVDDDDGRVEAFRIGDAVAANGQAGLPVLHLVFAGSWSSDAKGAIANDLRAHAVISDIRDVAASSKVNDLQVQRMIEPFADDSGIYVVFLSSSTESTLGASHAGVDYDSYHSHFHQVQYVVVPWHATSLREAAEGSIQRISD